MGLQFASHDVFVLRLGIAHEMGVIETREACALLGMQPLSHSALVFRRTERISFARMDPISVPFNIAQCTRWHLVNIHREWK